MHDFLEPYEISKEDLASYGMCGVTICQLLLDSGLASIFSTIRPHEWRGIAICNCPPEERTRHHAYVRENMYEDDEHLGTLRVKACKILHCAIDLFHVPFIGDRLLKHSYYVTKRGLRLLSSTVWSGSTDSAPYWAWKALTTGVERRGGGGGRVALPEVLIRVVEEFVGWRPKNPLRSIPQIVRTLDETTVVGPSNSNLWQLNTRTHGLRNRLANANVVVGGSFLLFTTMRSMTPFGRDHSHATPGDIDVYCSRDAFDQVIAVIKKSTNLDGHAVSATRYKVGRYDIICVPSSIRVLGKQRDYYPFDAAMHPDLRFLRGCVAFGYVGYCGQLLRFGLEERRAIEDGVMWLHKEQDPRAVMNTSRLKERLEKYERRGFRQGPTIEDAPASERRNLYYKAHFADFYVTSLN